VRNGTTSLFAALDVASGKVISATHRRHRHQEFLKFLKTIDRNVPSALEVHLICDNYGTHKTPEVKRWLLRHPRFQLHLTPTYSSWLNLVERWFAELTNRKLRRSAHRSVVELEADLAAWIQAWNDDPKPLYGPRPPTRSLRTSPAIFNESTTQDTRPRARYTSSLIGMIQACRDQERE
jgi:transposase